MGLDELNTKVTSAILHAESLPLGSGEARAAFREVSSIEESIAASTGPDDIEGEIARLGAVTGALSAGDAPRARELAERYASELSPPARARLDELLKEAEIEIESAAVDEPEPSVRSVAVERLRALASHARPAEVSARSKHKLLEDWDKASIYIRKAEQMRVDGIKHQAACAERIARKLGLGLFRYKDKLFMLSVSKKGVVYLREAVARRNDG